MEDCVILLEPLYVGIGFWGRGVRRGWEQGHAGMETVVGEERGQRGGRMLGIVIAEFCHVEKASPVRLLVIAEDPKVLFQNRIEALRLAIRVGMEGRRAVGLDAQEFHEAPP